MSDYRNNGVMDWEDTIESDDQFIILPDGDYAFTVSGFERGRFPGSAKIPACNKATITLQISSDAGAANIRTDLILHRSLEWKLSSFFRAIGQKKHGEKLAMDWQKVVGSRGRCHVKIRTYKDKDGNERTTNDVDRYYDYDPSKMKSQRPSEYAEDDGMDDDIPF